MSKLNRYLEKNKSNVFVQATVKPVLELVGEDLSKIINQDGDDVTDGEVLDEVIKYLQELNIYKERK
jgi:hypothetical protein